MATPPSLERLYVGASGWSYPSWKPGFYPADAKPAEFLRLYAERFRTVELNTTGYRLPAEEQFVRWREQVPDGFRFAVKMPAHRLDRVSTFTEHVGLLGDRLGPLRVVVPQARDDGFLLLLADSLPPEAQVAFDFRHPSWDGIELPRNAVAVDAEEADAPFRYLRLRDPPYDDEALDALAARVAALLAAGLEVYVYFRHEDEPTAPAYAEQLMTLISAAAGARGK